MARPATWIDSSTTTTWGAIARIESIFGMEGFGQGGEVVESALSVRKTVQGTSPLRQVPEGTATKLLSVFALIAEWLTLTFNKLFFTNFNTLGISVVLAGSLQ